MKNEIIMKGVREYGEGEPVALGDQEGRPVIIASNEAGHNSTSIDLVDVIVWLKANRPELLK